MALTIAISICDVVSGSGANVAGNACTVAMLADTVTAIAAMVNRIMLTPFLLPSALIRHARQWPQI
jgi:hypothetical protein